LPGKFDIEDIVMVEELRIPSEEELLANVKALAQREEAISLCLSALETGIFRHPDGRVDGLQETRLAP
jgi:hypothetical protein